MIADRVAALDETDFEQFVRESAGSMRAAIARVLRNDADTDETLQESFLAAWKARDSFAGRSSASTWLHRIAINTALNRLRQRKSIRELLESDHPGPIDCPSTIDVATSYANVSDTLALRELVWAAVDALPEDARLVLVLRDVEGLTSAEVADAVGISPAAVRQRLHRARQFVAERLAPDVRGAQNASCGGRLDLLMDYLDRELGPDLNAKVTEHLQHCPRCRQYARTYAATIALPRDAARGSTSAAR